MCGGTSILLPTEWTIMSSQDYTDSGVADGATVSDEVAANANDESSEPAVQTAGGEGGSKEEGNAAQAAEGRARQSIGRGAAGTVYNGTTASLGCAATVPRRRGG